MEWKSSATLHEINMPTEPIKVKAFVRQKEDGSLPVRVSTVVSSFCAYQCGFLFCRCTYKMAVDNLYENGDEGVVDHYANCLSSIVII